MRDKDLYATILGIVAPWVVREVDLRAEAEEIEVFIEHGDPHSLTCPECGAACARHDARRRSWRHLDTCQYRTTLTADVPRVKCPRHGVHQVPVPWAERNSRFTAMFECLAIDWLREANVKAVARRLRVSWDELDGIQRRAVRRGLERREAAPVSQVGVDETSFQRRHEYVTVVSELGQPARVLYVADGRGQEALEEFYKGLNPGQIEAIEAVAMDMWKPYIQATQAHVPGWEEKVCFDRFHVAKHLGDAVNDVRKAEHRELLGEGDERLKRTRFLWLMGPDKRARLSRERRSQFDELKTSTLKVARAWAIRETARGLWRYARRGWALRGWKRWLGWAFRSRLEPMRKVAWTVKKHLWGILNAVLKGVTNATAESLNAKIQWVKKNACGFRNRERFRTAIMFHCGGLDMYPRPSIHTES
jgi:transposase